MPVAGQKNYYEILDVSKGASAEEIKKSYRKQARKHHPDVNPGDADAEERFKEIAEAYHVLGDEERRSAYDRGPEQFAQEFDLSDFFSQFSHGVGGAQGGVHFNVGGLGDLFDVFGGRPGAGAAGRSWPVAQPGRDVEVTVQLGFEEAMKGAERTVRYGLPTAAGGSETVSTKVRVPAGVEDGKRIRVTGRGEPGNGGAPAGNLYLRVRVAPHPLFERKGADLRLELPVAVYEAGLGGTIRVPTLEGNTTIKLPAGTRNGQVIRLSGKGAPRPGAQGEEGRGDLLVTVRVELPETIDEDAAALLEKFQRDHPYDPRRNMK